MHLWRTDHERAIRLVCKYTQEDLDQVKGLALAMASLQDLLQQPRWCSILRILHQPGFDNQWCIHNIRESSWYLHLRRDLRNELSLLEVEVLQYLVTQEFLSLPTPSPVDLTWYAHLTHTSFVEPSYKYITTVLSGEYTGVWDPDDMISNLRWM